MWLSLNQKVIHHLSEMEMSNSGWGGGTWPSMCQHEVLPKHSFLKRKAFQKWSRTLYYRYTCYKPSDMATLEAAITSLLNTAT